MKPGQLIVWFKSKIPATDAGIFFAAKQPKRYYLCKQFLKNICPYLLIILRSPLNTATIKN
jgi:hypothetical protein